MSLSQREKDRRHNGLRKKMKEIGVETILVFGNTGDFGLRYGNLRYLTNSKVIFGNSALLFSMDQEPIMFMFSGLQAGWAKRLSWIMDARPSSNLISDIVNVLKSSRPSVQKLGVAGLPTIPLSWHQKLCQEFPSLDLMEIGHVIESMRSIKGQEEVELVEKAALLADKGFENVMMRLKPGMTEFEALALLEQPMREGGGDDFFNLIFSGPFEPGVQLTPFAITGRKEPSRTIQVGDSVLFEITPRYGGYWAQLVRTISIGKQNSLLADYYRVGRAAIEAAIKHFRPGVKLGDALTEAKNVIESEGYKLRLPMGHICGLDCVESRISVESEDILQPGMVIIFHPPVVGPEETDIFVGETYVITTDGYKCLSQSPKELMVIS